MCLNNIWNSNTIVKHNELNRSKYSQLYRIGLKNE